MSRTLADMGHGGGAGSGQPLSDPFAVSSYLDILHLMLNCADFAAGSLQRHPCLLHSICDPPWGQDKLRRLQIKLRELHLADVGLIYFKCWRGGVLKERGTGISLCC